MAKLPPMLKKLNGAIAKTKPSSGLNSNSFFIPSGDIGVKEFCIVYANSILKFKKSINSHDASTSAWKTLLPISSIAAALILYLYGPAIKSATFLKIFALSSKDVLDHVFQASNEESIAIWISSGPASW